MKSLLFLFLIIFSVSINAALEDIYLKDGRIYKNIQIRKEYENYYEIVFNNVCHDVYKSNISKVDSIPYREDIKSYFYNPKSIDFIPSVNDPLTSKITTYPNLKLLPISVIAFTLSLGYFKDASDIGNQIDINKRLNIGTSDLETSKTIKTVLGATSLIAGLINTFIAVTPVELTVNNNTASINYKFFF